MGFFDITSITSGLNEIEKNLKGAQDKALELELLKLKSQDQAPIGSRVEWGTNAMGLPTAKMVPWAEDPRIKAQQADLMQKLQIQYQFEQRSRDLENFDKLLQGTQSEIARLSGQPFEQREKLNTALGPLFAAYQTGDPDKRARLNTFFQSLSPELKQTATDFTTKALGGVAPPVAGPTGSTAVPAQGAPGIPNLGAGTRQGTVAAQPKGAAKAPSTLIKPGAEAAIQRVFQSDPAEGDRRRKAFQASGGDPSAFQLKYAALLEQAGKPATQAILNDVTESLFVTPKKPGEAAALEEGSARDIMATLSSVTTETPAVQLDPVKDAKGKIIDYNFLAQSRLAENPGLVASLKRGIEAVGQNTNLQGEAYDSGVRKIGQAVKAELAQYLKGVDIKRSSTKAGTEVRILAEPAREAIKQDIGLPGVSPFATVQEDAIVLLPNPKSRRGVKTIQSGTQFIQDLGYLMKLADDVSTLVVVDRKGNLIQRVVN